MKAEADKLFQEAIEKLNQAKEELYRPKEDLVTYLICKNAQFSIESFLKGYLLQNDINPIDYQTIDSLFEKCKALNKGFEKVDLRTFDCKSDNVEAHYCADTPKVCECFNISVNLENFLKQEKVIV